MQPIKADLPISVTLVAEQWNQVIALCAEGPWRIANPIINELGRQLNAAAEASVAAPAVNGAEAPHVPN